MKVYEAIYEDLTGLGGPMGAEHTSEVSLGLFETPQKAKEACDSSYKKIEDKDYEKLVWKGRLPHLQTKDLRYVMYHVVKRGIK